MELEVLEPGLSTTVQDRGRRGYYRFGIPEGGAMDQESAEVANRLVGNLGGEAVLECTYLGPRLVARGDLTIAITGAPVEARIDDEPVPTWTRLQLRDGQSLSFGMIGGGMKYFVGVQGGIDVPVVLGSRSTYPIGALGGFHGRALAAGDLLPVGVGPASDLPVLDSLHADLRPAFAREVTARVVLGLYDHRLTAAGMANLLDEPWTLTPVADRMGLRYSGPGVEWVDDERPFGAGQDPSNIVDAGYAVGSIQIPGGTQPIVLHREAVSGGGYAMVATVISADLDLLARSSPGTITRFEAVTLEQAVEARADRAEVMRSIWS